MTGFEWEIAMQEARKKVKNSTEEIDAYLIWFDGSIPTVDGRVRGLFYEIGERGTEKGYQYMVGYKILENNTVELYDEYNFVLKEIDNLID